MGLQNNEYITRDSSDSDNIVVDDFKNIIIYDSNSNYDLYPEETIINLYF